MVVELGRYDGIAPVPSEASRRTHVHHLSAPQTVSTFRRFLLCRNGGARADRCPDWFCPYILSGQVVSSTPSEPARAHPCRGVHALDHPVYNSSFAGVGTSLGFAPAPWHLRFSTCHRHDRVGNGGRE